MRRQSASGPVHGEHHGRSRRPGRRLALLALVSGACLATATGCSGRPARRASLLATSAAQPILTASTPAAVTTRTFARRRTLRLRSISCDGVATGSGFIAADHVLVTNRHVVKGAYELDAETWDGTTLRLGIAEQAVIADLGIIRVTGTTPPPIPLATTAPGPGTRVFAAGYPLGDEFRLTSGRVIGLTDQPNFGNAGGTLRVTTEVQPGNSGGPLLDRSGQVVGVVFAIEEATGDALVIPVQTLRHALGHRSLFHPVTPCG